ncbi:MAG TPA: sugar phosphate isomerase/epimerase family protein [Bryobacteraceae bacterium]|nr:sugar phosphate isomerase/epimerase family protein [Bryobacteraceae bacterium]
MTRRDFVLGAAATAVSLRAATQPAPALCIFSKHLPDLGYDELGKVSREMGFDGVDLTVRKGGHVLPAQAADLPRAVEAIRAHKVAVPMITTEILDAAAAETRPILTAAARSGVKLWKPGYWRFTDQEDPAVTLGRVKGAMAKLGALSHELGLTAGFHNHSGNYVGASGTWDVREILAGIDARDAGAYFDVCHATAEGGVYGWQLGMRLLGPRIKMVALKDFYWAKNKMTMCPMGEGVVDWQKYFAALRGDGFSGPVSLHMEYKVADERAAIARDAEFARKHMKKAWPQMDADKR